jgi:hypothetical protein
VSGRSDFVDDRLRIRWQSVATVVGLGIALGVSIAAGRTWDALIIGAMLAFGVCVIGSVAYLRRKSGRVTRR